MEVIHVKAAVSDYDVIVGDDILARFADVVAGFDPGGELVVVTDDEVNRHFRKIPPLPRSAHRAVHTRGPSLHRSAVWPWG